MAGAFTTTAYELDSGTNVPIRVQPETLAANIGAVNAAPTGGAAAGWPSAMVSKSKRGLGIHPRTVSVRFTATPPEGYAANVAYTIPVLKKSVWDAITPTTTGTYLGVAVKYAGKSPEVIR